MLSLPCDQNWTKRGRLELEPDSRLRRTTRKKCQKAVVGKYEEISQCGKKCATLHWNRKKNFKKSQSVKKFKGLLQTPTYYSHTLTTTETSISYESRFNSSVLEKVANPLVIPRNWLNSISFHMTELFILNCIICLLNYWIWSEIERSIFFSFFSRRVFLLRKNARL